MTKLHDPNLPPGEIVEKREDGIWVRNDGVELSPAEKNPYYVMATIYGEQGERLDKNLAAKNRRIWNGWMCSGMDGTDSAKLAEKLGLDAKELAPLSKAETDRTISELTERAQWANGLPDPLRVDLGRCYFSNHVVFEKFYFARDNTFHLAHFAKNSDFSSVHFATHTSISSVFFERRADFSSSYFGGVAEFSGSTFNARASFTRANFLSYAEFAESLFKGHTDFSRGTFDGPTDFSDAVFLRRVPVFAGCKLYDDTRFTCERGNWPALWRSRKQDFYLAREEKGSFRRLRQISEANHNPEDEHFFLRQELACSGVDPKSDWISRYVVRTFGWISDYGYSVGRPGGCCWPCGLVRFFYF